jgi:hypothetical protein
MMMHIAHDFGLVRIVHQDLDIVVQIKRNDQWEFYSSYNMMSDDWAFTNARESAGRAIKSMAAEAAQLGA